MAYYPLYNDLRKRVYDLQVCNFGLWFNKFVPLDSKNNCKPSNQTGDSKKPVEYYLDRYMRFTKSASRELNRKHAELDSFCETMKERFTVISLKGTLVSPLVTGIGESHPHEVSMVFDHNLGLPYVPASGIKGIVRFARTLSIIDDILNGKDNTEIRNDTFHDDEHETIIQLFGNQERRGKVVFLDAYPQNIPKLRMDIMNPHYGEYYSGDNTPPRDSLEPNPIKFLTVAPGESFIFRALALEEHAQEVVDAFKQALEKEGVGAKTAIGYGRFNLETYNPAETNVQSSSAGKENDVSSNTIQQGDIVTGVLLDVVSKKGKRKVRCKDDNGLEGFINNSGSLPPDKKAGEEVSVKISVIGGVNSQFEYVP